MAGDGSSGVSGPTRARKSSSNSGASTSTSSHGGGGGKSGGGGKARVARRTVSSSSLKGTTGVARKSGRKALARGVGGKGQSLSASDFELKTVLGSGASGTAHLAVFKDTGSKCVIKRVAIGGGNLNLTMGRGLKAAMREVELLRSLRHPNIVRCYGSFVDGGDLCVVMDYCDGGDLAAVLSAQREGGEHFTEETITTWMTQLGLALQALGEKYILHRDIKPGNLFLSGNARVLKLGDFGIAKRLESTQDVVASTVGTPHYMSPELVQGKPYSLKTDVWAMGCVLRELTTFKKAFPGSNMAAVVMAIVQNRVTPIPSFYSRPLVNLADMMVRPDPDDRPTPSAILASPAIRAHAQLLLSGGNNHNSEEGGTGRGTSSPDCPGTLVEDEAGTGLTTARGVAERARPMTARPSQTVVPVAALRARANDKLVGARQIQLWEAREAMEARHAARESFARSGRTRARQRDPAAREQRKQMEKERKKRLEAKVQKNGEGGDGRLVAPLSEAAAPSPEPPMSWEWTKPIDKDPPMSTGDVAEKEDGEDDMSEPLVGPNIVEELGLRLNLDDVNEEHEGAEDTPEDGSLLRQSSFRASAPSAEVIDDELAAIAARARDRLVARILAQHQALEVQGGGGAGPSDSLLSGSNSPGSPAERREAEEAVYSTVGLARSQRIEEEDDEEEESKESGEGRRGKEEEEAGGVVPQSPRKSPRAAPQESPRKSPGRVKPAWMTEGQLPPLPEGIWPAPPSLETASSSGSADAVLAELLEEAAGMGGGADKDELRDEIKVRGLLLRTMSSGESQELLREAARAAKAEEEAQGDSGEEEGDAEESDNDVSSSDGYGDYSEDFDSFSESDSDSESPSEESSESDGESDSGDDVDEDEDVDVDADEDEDEGDGDLDLVSEPLPP